MKYQRHIHGEEMAQHITRRQRHRIAVPHPCVPSSAAPRRAHCHAPSRGRHLSADPDELAGLDGQSKLARQLRAEFDAYYAAATRATGIMLGTAEGDPARAVSAMQTTMRSFTELLGSSNEAALDDFQALLSGSADDVRQTLTVSMITALSRRRCAPTSTRRPPAAAPPA